MSIKVLIAHGNMVFCEGLSRLLADDGDIEVVAKATDGESAVRMATDKRPDVAILYIDMPKINGIEAAKQVKSNCPNTAVLMLSEYKYGANILPSLRAGALGYLLESCPLSELVGAIRSVHGGEEVLAPKATADILHRLVIGREDKAGPFLELHQRELEILKLVAKGMSNSGIASQLMISERTVSSHLRNIFRKLGVSSRTEAVVFALRSGIIILDELG